MASLLLVEDNEDLLENLYLWLEPLGYELDSARNGAQAMELACASQYDCIVLDINLPRLDGFTVCSRLREDHGIRTPIIMLTARDSIDDRVHGLSLGADDYLVKPFSLKELQARIEAVLRRPPLATRVLTFGPIQLDRSRRRITRDGADIRLSPAGFRILEKLMLAAPGMVSRQELETMLWGDETPGSGALRNHILDIRRRLDRPFSWPVLETVPHSGYRLRENAAQ